MALSGGRDRRRNDAVITTIAEHHDLQHRRNAAPLDLRGRRQRGFDIGRDSGADHLGLTHCHGGTPV